MSHSHAVKEQTSTPTWRVAVITPYWREAPDVLAKCMASVREQTHRVTHILVSDGVPAQLPERPDLIHVQLPYNIGNSGGTPRGLGAQLAFNLGFDAVAFLDADNWYEPDHIERAVKALQQEDVDVVFARRRMVFPDGEVMTVADASDESGRHVDTNCYVMSKRAAFLLPVWLMWPQDFGIGEDRMMLVLINKMRLRTTRLSVPTVWYQTNWPLHYRLQGKTPVAPLRAPKRSVHTHFNEGIFHQMTGLSAPPVAAGQPQARQDPPKIGRVIVDWRMRAPRVTRMTPMSDLDLIVMPDDVPHPCEVLDTAGVHALKLPRHRGYSGTAAGLGAALAFMKGCDRVVVMHADWTLAGDAIGARYQRLQCLDVPFHAESFELPNGETGYVMVYDREHAYLGLLAAQLPMTLDVEARFQWVKALGVWRTLERQQGKPPALPQPVTRAQAADLLHRTGLQLLGRPRMSSGAA